MKSLLTAMSAVALLSACATSRPYHFYILSTQPQGAAEARTTPPLQVGLKVTLPSLVDRPEMILNTSADGVQVLDHERWAAPLADLVTQTLARDIERRRSDMWVADSSANRNVGAIKITVNVVQMTLRRGANASIETHWRIVNSRTGQEEVGGAVFSASLGQDSYAQIAQALSECLGQLADRLLGTDALRLPTVLNESWAASPEGRA